MFLPAGTVVSVWNKRTTNGMNKTQARYTGKLYRSFLKSAILSPYREAPNEYMMLF